MISVHLSAPAAKIRSGNGGFQASRLYTDLIALSGRDYERIHNLL
jgi:hypothetical protein